MRATAVLILLALAACRDEAIKRYDVKPGSGPRSSSGLSEAERSLEEQQQIQQIGTPQPPAPPDPAAAPPAAPPTPP